MHARIPIVLAIIVMFVAQRAAVRAQSKGRPNDAPQTIVAIVDFSESTKTNLPPNTFQPFITQAIHVGILSDRPVRMAVVMVSGKGVNVLGDDKGMPTSALTALHRKVLNEWVEPQGGTPLDEAFGVVVNMVRASGGPVTVINIGDGRPSTLLQPEKYQSVREAIDKKIEAIRSLGRPPRITQQSIDQFLHVLKFPGNWDQLDPQIATECRRIFDLQTSAQFELCKSHVAVLRGAKVRFISVDVSGGVIPELRELHETANGQDTDYLAIAPGNIIQALHEVGLLQLDRIIVPKPITVDPDPSQYEREIDVALPQVAEAALLTVVFDKPIEDFDKHLELLAEADGSVHHFNLQNSSQNAILSLDSIGRTATATLMMPSMPASGQLKLRVKSPGFSMLAPGMTIFTHLRLSSDLQPTLRPEHFPDSQPLPYSLAPSRRFDLVGWLGVKDDPKPLPLAGLEVVWNSRSDSRAVRAEMQADNRRPGVFRSADQLQIPVGQYDAEVNYLLESGAQFKLKIPLHLQCFRNDEHLTVEISDTSKSPGHIDAGQLGDETREYEVTVLLRSRNVDYPIQIQPRIVGLIDQQGLSPEGEWITATPTTISVAPGRAARVNIAFKLPEVIEDSLADGLFTAQLQCLRTDLDTLVDLRPFKEVFAPTDRYVDEVTFALSRPRFEPSAPRGPIDELNRVGEDHWNVTINNHVGLPLRRSFTLDVRNTSRSPRTIDAVVLGQFRNERQQYVDDVTLTLAEDQQQQVDVASGCSARFTFDFNAETAEDCQTVLRISGPGFSATEVPVFYRAHEPFKAQTLQSASFLLGFVLLPLAAVAFLRRRNNLRFGTGKTFQMTKSTSTDTLSLQRGGRGAARLTSQVKCKETRQQQSRPRPMPRQKRLTAADMDQRNPLLVIEQHPHDDSMELALERLDFAQDGEPELQTRIVDGGRYQKRAERFGKRFSKWLVLAAALLVLGYFFLHPHVLSAVQFLWDVVAHSW